jgi:hypothetical protein
MRQEVYMSKYIVRLSGVLVVTALLLTGCFEAHGSFDLEERSGNAGERVAVRGKPVVVPEGRIHYGDVVVVDGKADIQGEVLGNVVVIAGDLRVGPKATIAEDLVSLGNRTSEVAPEAQVQGERVFVHWSGVQWFVDTTLFAATHPMLVVVTGGVALLVVCLLGWLLVIRRYDPERFHYTVDEHPVRAGLLGLLTVVALHVLIVLAFFSRWGVGLVPVLGLLILALTVLGWVVVGGHVGRWLAQRYQWQIGPFLYGLIGVGIIMVAFSLPVVGQLATLLASWIGIGALLSPSKLPKGGLPQSPSTPTPAPSRSAPTEAESLAPLKPGSNAPAHSLSAG